MEDKFSKIALNALHAQNCDACGNPEKSDEVRFGITEGVDKPFLYDLVFEKEDTSHTGASKVHRCKLSIASVILGPWLTCECMVSKVPA
jgi:hypothetical protein